MFPVFPLLSLSSFSISTSSGKDVGTLPILPRVYIHGANNMKCKLVLKRKGYIDQHNCLGLFNITSDSPVILVHRVHFVHLKQQNDALQYIPNPF